MVEWFVDADRLGGLSGQAADGPQHQRSGGSGDLVDFEERLRARVAAVSEVEEQLSSARYTGTSDGEQVVATADHRGRLINLDFGGIALTRTRATELGRQAVQAVNHAQSEAGHAVVGALFDRLGSPPGGAQ